MITEVEQILNEISKIHEKKNQDYAAQTNQFENFERSAELISWFKNDEDKAFVALIATKLARLATLLNKGGVPNNESIEDSFLDLDTYCVLWHGYYKRINHKEKSDLLVTQVDSSGFTVLRDQHESMIRNLNYTTVGEKYQCEQCGAQFSYAPHVAFNPLQIGSKQAFYFDTKRCVDDFVNYNRKYTAVYATLRSTTPNDQK